MPTKPKPVPKPILLNEEQQAVVSAREGFWCCQAGPGSGKSQTLVQRYAALIQEGVSPDDILSLSFTATSAKNLRDRVETLVGKLTTSRVAGAVTFHSFCLSFAQEERESFSFELAEFPLASEPVANKLAGESARRFEIDSRVLRSAVSLWRRKRVGALEAIKSSENLLDPKQLKLALAYKDYNKRCEAERLLDFDGLIFHAVQIMDKKPDVRERWARKFVMVDEAQDCSKIEWDLAKLVAGTSVLAVGDVSQGIYGFRGSDPKLFSNMYEMFPGTQTLFLSCNYRSSPEIVDFIRPIASSRELAEKFHTGNKSTGVSPLIKGFSNPVDEANFVVKCIKEGL